MVIEYVGPNIAMALVLMFGLCLPIYNTGTTFSTETVLLALLAQHGPELLCDAAAMFFEIRAGLDLVGFLQGMLKWRVFANKALCACFGVSMCLLVDHISTGLKTGLGVRIDQ